MVEKWWTGYVSVAAAGSKHLLFRFERWNDFTLARWCDRFTVESHQDPSVVEKGGAESTLLQGTSVWMAIWLMMKKMASSSSSLSDLVGRGLVWHPSVSLASIWTNRDREDTRHSRSSHLLKCDIMNPLEAPDPLNVTSLARVLSLIFFLRYSFYFLGEILFSFFFSLSFLWGQQIRLSLISIVLTVANALFADFQLNVTCGH